MPSFFRWKISSYNYFISIPWDLKLDNCAPQTSKLEKRLRFTVTVGLSKNCPRKCCLADRSLYRIWTFSEVIFLARFTPVVKTARALHVLNISPGEYIDLSTINNVHWASSRKFLELLKLYFCLRTPRHQFVRKISSRETRSGCFSAEKLNCK